MNSVLKSIFISILPLLALYFTLDSVLHLINHGLSSTRYFGRLLIAISIVVLFASLFLKPVARTDTNLKIYSTFISIGLLISLWFGVYKEGDLFGSLPSITLFLGWVLYLRWYSVFKNRNSNTVLKKGIQFPNITLEDFNKNKITTNAYIGNPTIFLFYRGNWCPLCMAQIKEIASQYKELEKRNVHVVLISPQPHTHSRSLAKKYNLNFNFLVDPNGKVAQKLEIFAKNGLPMGLQAFGYDKDTVQPTVVITDQKGRIIFADLTDNYRVRPEPETFIKVIDTISSL